MSSAPVFGDWLAETPVDPSRFLRMLRADLLAIAHPRGISRKAP
jgi:hypothetical protein